MWCFNSGCVETPQPLFLSYLGFWGVSHFKGQFVKIVFGTALPKALRTFSDNCKAPCRLFFFEIFLVPPNARDKKYASPENAVICFMFRRLPSLFLSLSLFLVSYVISLLLFFLSFPSCFLSFFFLSLVVPFSWLSFLKRETSQEIV